MTDFRFLITGHDTIECAYYFAMGNNCLFDFERLAVEKELLRQSKSRKPTPIKLGSEEFMLASHGTGSGYPLLLENDVFSIQCGEFNKPSFFVTFRSIALWHSGAVGMHRRFLAWAHSVGLFAYQPERLSRVDFTFDYYLPVLDFDEDNFVSSAVKDTQHRKNGKLQSFKFGEGDVLIRIYNKSDEIVEKSAKTWFYDLWGIEHGAWRFEWQVRKSWLRRFGIRTFEDLSERQGDLLRVLVNDHTALRIKSGDSNRSRWPLHPLWQDLSERVARMEGLGVVRELDRDKLLDERELRIAISVYGYLKRLAAIHAIRHDLNKVTRVQAQLHLSALLSGVHDALTWEPDVERRITEMRLGEW